MPIQSVRLAARRTLLEELAYHYQLDYPEFDRFPFVRTTSEPDHHPDSIPDPIPGPEQPEEYDTPQEATSPQSYTRSLRQTPTPPTPLVMQAMERKNRPTFAICGTFSGEKESASKWLMKYDMEMEDYMDDEGRFPPRKYLGFLEALLTGDASDWSESHPVVSSLLREAKLNPTNHTVESFRTLFCERFPSRVIEESPIPFDLEIAELKQRSEESLPKNKKITPPLDQRH